MTKIEWDEWRQDIRRLNGSLIKKDVLFVRGKLDKVEFHAPIFDEEDPKAIEDMKQMIEMSLRNHVE